MNPISMHWPWVALGAALVLVVWYDLRYRQIPDWITLPLIIIGPILSPAAGSVSLAQSLAGVGVGAIIPLGTAWIFERWSGVEALGRGDVKLLAGIGGFVGPWLALVALFLSSFSLVMVFLVLRMAGRAGLKTYFPFGPYIVWGTFLSVILHCIFPGF